MGDTTKELMQNDNCYMDSCAKILEFDIDRATSEDASQESRSFWAGSAKDMAHKIVDAAAKDNVYYHSIGRLEGFALGIGSCIASGALFAALDRIFNKK